MENTNLNNEQVTNPLLNPLNHSIEDLLKEIQFGRPAETQLQIQKWIDELTQEKLLGKTISKEVADKDSFEETCDRLFPTAAIERKIVKENQQKDKLAIEFGEWLCEKAEVPYIKGTMGGTLEVFKKEKGII